MTPLQSSHCSGREGDVEFHRSILVNSVNRQFAGELLCSLWEVSTSCPQIQWAPLQLKGCTQKYFIALYHYAIGGVAAHCTCPRRCSHHHRRYEGDDACPPRPPEPSLGSMPFFLVKCLYASSLSSCVGAHWWIPMGGCGSLCCSLCVLHRSWVSRFSLHRVSHSRSVGEGDFQSPAGGIQWPRGTST